MSSPLIRVSSADISEEASVHSEFTFNESLRAYLGYLSLVQLFHNDSCQNKLTTVSWERAAYSPLYLSHFCYRRAVLCVSSAIDTSATTLSHGNAPAGSTRQPRTQSYHPFIYHSITPTASIHYTDNFLPRFGVL